METGSICESVFGSRVVGRAVRVGEGEVSLSVCGGYVVYMI